MTKAILTIEDTNEDGSVSINCEFDPPLEKGKPGNATAQYLAAKAVAYLRALCSGNEDDYLSEEDDEDRGVCGYAEQ